jgi:hypothetical protein
LIWDIFYILLLFIEEDSCTPYSYRSGITLFMVLFLSYLGILGFGFSFNMSHQGVKKLLKVTLATLAFGSKASLGNLYFCVWIPFLFFD